MAYTERIQKVKSELTQQKRQYNQLSNMRLLVSVIGIILFALAITKRRPLFLVGFVIFGIIFVLLIKWHDNISSKMAFSDGELGVLINREKRKDNKWHDFEESGKEFIDEHTTVEGDLDIFGPDSLYQYLCVANTQKGKERLAAYLTDRNPDFDKIRERQKAIEELTRHFELSINLEIGSYMIGKSNKKESDEWYRSFLKYVTDHKKLLPNGINFLSKTLPLVFGASILLVMNNVVNELIVLLLFSIQIIGAYFVNFKTQNLTSKIYKFTRNIETYQRLISGIEEAKFESKHLIHLQKELITNLRATEGIEKLCSISDALKLQYNPYVHFVVQGFLMYDIQCIVALEKWKKTYGSSVDEWFNIIGEFEALLSLSVIGRNDNVTYPEFIHDNQLLWKGEDIYHPLIANEQVVTNSISLNAETIILTGSNMSGKTTFLRTIGINTVLAYAGAPVCAKNLQVSKMKLFTSMRVQDDVSKGISTFYAEVLRIKEIVNFTKMKLPCLILIDEIFKGTNSADRIVGAREVIKSLNKPHTILLVSTHDFELCDLVQDNYIKGKNYHFNEHYKNNKILFDYKLKQGRCQTTNAKYILEMAGIL